MDLSRIYQINNLVYPDYILCHNCSFEFKLPESEDFQYEFVFFYYDPDDWFVPIGELIRRNGIFVKDINIPYTPESPCWTRSGEVILSFRNVDLAYNSTFCCKNFEAITLTTLAQTKTTSDILLSSTSTLPSPSSLLPTNNPNLNLSGTQCSTKTSEAWLDIIFVIDTAAAMSHLKLKKLSGEIATTLQYFTFDQNGDHTIRAALVIYGSNITTLFEFNNVTTFSQFEIALFSLFNHYNPYDSGSNVYGALDAAYKLLQAQKSHRLPVIVLASATYSSTGFQGAPEISQFIKSNGTSIMVINFDSENPDLTKALQIIASPGYNYVSTEQDLYITLVYAFTQINCICPLHSKQFRIFNPSSNNYTNFADCLYGVNGDISPIYANILCSPGTLVSIRNPEIFDFITDEILPYDLLKVKKFSIGLHKSDSDGLWKWWNYDGSETPLGEYPSMSTTPDPSDNYGYMWNYKGFQWKLQTANNLPLPYICQIKACDAENICDLTSVKMN
uniref:VWFA domain-containing protein n=1 Tax=Panagrolaimus davidi TaxID=227884 RepID=A0A914PMA7_9BILA